MYARPQFQSYGVETLNVASTIHVDPMLINISVAPIHKPPTFTTSTIEYISFLRLQKTSLSVIIG